MEGLAEALARAVRKQGGKVNVKVASFAPDVVTAPSGTRSTRNTRKTVAGRRATSRSAGSSTDDPEPPPAAGAAPEWLS